MIKLLSVLVLSTVFFSSLVVAGGHSKGKTTFLWERTFHMKPGVSPPEAIQVVGKALAFVNKNYPEVNVVMKSKTIPRECFHYLHLGRVS